MTTTVWIEATIAATIARYTPKRATRCAGVKRCQSFWCAASVIFEMAFTARRKPADAAAEEVHGRQAVDEDRPCARCEDLARHDQGDDRDQDRADVVVIEALERREQGSADAPCADDPDHRRVAQVRVELVGAEADEACEDLWQHAKGDDTAERSTGGAHRLDLLQRDLLDRLGEELADESDRSDGQREYPGQRAEADRLDEQDRHDHRVE